MTVADQYGFIPMYKGVIEILIEQALRIESIIDAAMPTLRKELTPEAFKHCCELSRAAGTAQAIAFSLTRAAVQPAPSATIGEES